MIRNSKVAWLAGFALASAASGACTGTYLPVVAAPAAVKVPQQQLVIAQAAEQAFSQLSFKEFRGATGYVTVSGVFPHTSDELGEFIRDSVEAKLAEDGVTVKHTMMKQNGDTMWEEAPADAQYEFAVGVQAAGGDIKVEGFFVREGTYIGRVHVKVMAIPLAGGRAKTVEAKGEDAKVVYSSCCLSPAPYTTSNPIPGAQTAGGCCMPPAPGGGR